MYPPVPSSTKHEFKVILRSSLVCWTPLWPTKMLSAVSETNRFYQSEPASLTSLVPIISW